MAGSASTASDHGVSEGQPSQVRSVLADDPWLGRVIDGRYRIEGVLGAGGVGVVYRAEHTGLRQPVALKVLRHGYEDRGLLRRRFEREATVLSQLRHPNIVGLTDYGISDGVPYLVMELLAGRTLADLLDDDGPPEPEVAIEIVRSIARGLAFAHARGVLHRDLKPANVFLQALPDDPHHVKLLDFGLAKILADEDDLAGEPTLTKAGTIVGTPAYMAPEQGAGQRVDARADVYSVGVLLFELLTGYPPFVSERRAELLRLHMIAPVPDPCALRPRLAASEEILGLLHKALAKDPGDRFQDASELLAALDALPPVPATLDAADPESGGHSRTLRAAAKPPQPVPSSRGRGHKAAALVPLALVAAGALAYAGMSRRDTSLAAPSTTASEPATSTTLATSAPSSSSPSSSSSSSSSSSAAAPRRPPDPFDQPLDEELRALRERLGAADALDREAHLATRIYQRLHPDDVRPSLLLAHDLADRGAWGPAIERYRVAVARGAQARRDPRMLEDLLRAAQMERYAREAAAAIADIFGREAIGAVEDRLARTENRQRRRRLRALLAQLRALPEGASAERPEG